MKLDSSKIGLTAATLFALAFCVPSCDPGGDGETGAGTGTGVDDNDDAEESPDDGDDDGSGSGTAGNTSDDAPDTGDETPDDSGDDGPVGMGIDPPTFDCSAATGTLVDKFFVVDAGEFDEVEMLDGIGIVDGNVEVNASNYNNLDFLACITEITGDLIIFGNDFLVDASGTNQITSLGGDFVFTKNNAITDFNGMGALDQITRSTNPEPPPAEIFHSLVMNDNEAMEAVSGWGSLVVIFGNITMRANPVLENIDGFSSLRAIGLTLAITHNNNLCISSVNAVGAQIQQPCIAGPPACEPQVMPPASWSTIANNEGC